MPWSSFKSISLMKYVLLSIVIICITVTQCIAQDNEIDSLDKIIASTTVDSIKLDCLIKQSDHYIGKGNFDNAISTLKKAINISKKINNDVFLVDTYDKIARTFMLSQQTDSCFAYCIKEYEQTDTINKTKVAAILLKNIGTVSFYKGDINDAIGYLQGAIDIYLRLNDSAMLATCYNNIAVFYDSQGDNKITTEYYLKALDHVKKGEYSKMEGMINENIATLFIQEEEFEKSLPFLMKSKAIFDSLGILYFQLTNYNNLGCSYLNLKQYDSAEYYLLSVLEKQGQAGLSRVTATAHNNITDVYLRKKEIEKAQKHAEEGYKLANELNDIDIKLTNILLRVKIHLHRKQYESSVKLCKDGMQLAEENNKLRFIHDFSNFQQISYEKTGNYKLAYQALKKNKLYSDSLTNKANIQALTKVELESEFERKQQQAAQIAQQKEYEQNLKIKKQTNLRNIALLAVFIIALSAILIVYLIKNSQQRKEQKLKESLNFNKQQVLSQQMNPHFFFNVLSTIQYHIFNDDKDASLESVQKFASLMRQTLENYQYRLIPLEQELSLLDLYIDLEKGPSNKFTFNVEIEKEIDISQIKVPSFIIQPIVENAIKHGIKSIDKNGEINLYLKKVGEFLLCVVTDNGVGLEASSQNNKNPKHKSRATDITMKRLALLSEYFQTDLFINYNNITSDDGEILGTIVQMKLPWIKETSKKSENNT